jgi:hypothetical protein
MIASRFALGALPALALGLVAVRAQAEPEVRLEYSAPEGCLDRAQFVAKVAERGGRVQGAESAARVGKLEVSIAPGASGGFVGTLLVTAADGSSTPREIHDPDCAEVATGLAVVAAIALGGGEEAESRSEPAPAPPPAEEPRPVEEPARPAVAEPRLRGSSYGRPDSVEVTAGTLRFERDRRFTFKGGVDYGLVPELLMPRFDLTGSLGEFVVTPSGSTHLVGPVLQVRWTLYGPASKSDAGRSTDTLGFSAGFASCSAITYDDSGLSLLACGEFDVGSMSVKTTDSEGSSSKKNSGFGLAGLSLDAQYSVGKLLHLGLQLGGRLQFGAIDANDPGGQQDSDVSVFFGGYATVGLGLHF